MDEFAEKNTDKFLYKILDKLLKYSNEKEMNNHEENNFSIFFHTISAAFYKLNAPLYHEEIINLLDIKPDQSPVHKRVKITNENGEKAIGNICKKKPDIARMSMHLSRESRQ